MSKCISSDGEYSDHELAEQPRFMCARCFAFDEDAAVARVRELEATVEKVREYIVASQNSPGLGESGHHRRWLREALEAIGGDDA